MEIKDLRCEGCGMRDLLAIAPGVEPEETDQFLLLRGEPARAWCHSCWLRRNGIRPTEAGLDKHPRDGQGRYRRKGKGAL